MAKGNTGIYLTPMENDSDSFNSETEKCLNTSIPLRKLRCIVICAILIIFAFVVGLVIGLFTKTDETCENNEADIHDRRNRDHSANLQSLLNAFDREEIRRNSR
jgi:Ca2+/H+ antiporter